MKIEIIRMNNKKDVSKIYSSLVGDEDRRYLIKMLSLLEYHNILRKINEEYYTDKISYWQWKRKFDLIFYDIKGQIDHVLIKI